MRTQLALPVVVVCCLLASCGPSAKQRTLRTTLVGLNAARDGFVAWDYAHQQAIVDDATSLEDGKAKLKEYRQKREKVLVSFEIAYRALAVGALDMSVANIGEALRAADDLYAAVKDLKAALTDKPVDALVPATALPALTNP